DDEPTVYINSVAATEGDFGATDAVFTLTLSTPSPIPVTVDYKTADKSAIAGSDYLAATGTVTFAPGVTAQTITVKILGDTVVEADQEVFRMYLTGSPQAHIYSGWGEGAIVDDDAYLWIYSASVAEGNAGTVGAPFMVTHSRPRSQSVTVAYSTANGTA